MATLFEDLKEGLNQAIDFAEGKGSARVFTYKIDPVKEYDNERTDQANQNGRRYDSARICRLSRGIDKNCRSLGARKDTSDRSRIQTDRFSCSG